MLQITICDDEAAQIELLFRYVKEWQKETDTEISVDKYDSADRFFFAWEEKKQTDILLLDIEMPGMDGMMLARKLREQGEAVQIIFVTGKPDYVFMGYEVEAVSYLMKPVKKEQLFSCLNRAKERCSKKEPELIVEETDEVQKIRVRDICYLESEAHDTRIYPACGKADTGLEKFIRCKKGIHSLETELAEKSENFFKPHRSYLVNLSHIEKITRKDVVMDTGAVIPLARGKWEEMNLAYLKFCRKNEGE